MIRHSPLDASVDALAVHRLTKLVIDDHITEPLRNKVYERFGDPSESKISYLVGCPWCVSVYMGLGVSVARTVAPGVWRPLAYALALSSLTGLIEEHV